MADALAASCHCAGWVPSVCCLCRELSASRLDLVAGRRACAGSRGGGSKTPTSRRCKPASDREVVDVDVGAVVTAVVDDLRAAYPSHAIELDLGTKENLLIRGDHSQIHQAVLNLGANACQHTEVGAKVEILVQPRAGSLTICVVDHGAGISPNDIDKVFIPFYRADVSRTRSGHGGAGLGLTLAKQIVEGHNGEISVVATPGGGATFKLVFPT